MQPRYLDGQWVAATKVDGYWGEELSVDVANDPWGPWTNVDRAGLSPRGGDPLMNTYHAHLMPWLSGGALVVSVSQNARNMTRDAFPIRSATGLSSSPSRWSPPSRPTRRDHEHHHVDDDDDHDHDHDVDHPDDDSHRRPRRPPPTTDHHDDATTTTTDDHSTDDDDHLDDLDDVRPRRPPTTTTTTTDDDRRPSRRRRTLSVSPSPRARPVGQSVNAERIAWRQPRRAPRCNRVWA